jgi:hypothetical protein
MRLAKARQLRGFFHGSTAAATPFTQESIEHCLRDGSYEITESMESHRACGLVLIGIRMGWLGSL